MISLHLGALVHQNERWVTPECRSVVVSSNVLRMALRLLVNTVRDTVHYAKGNVDANRDNVIMMCIHQYDGGVYKEVELRETREWTNFRKFNYYVHDLRYALPVQTEPILLARHSVIDFALVELSYVADGAAARYESDICPMLSLAPMM